MIQAFPLRTSYPLAIQDKIERLWRMCAFGAPFGSVFQPIFGGEKVAEVPWYLLGDIAAANCLAAHQPLGAASLAASYDDIAHAATTWDAAPGTAPTFDASYGWDFTAANLQYLVVGSGAMMPAVPITLISLFQSKDTTAAYSLMSINDTAAFNRFALYIAGSLAGDPVAADIDQGATEKWASTSTGYTSNTWYVAAATYSTSTARAAYINGGSKGTETTNLTPAGLDTNCIGCAYSGVPRMSYLNGKIAADAWYDIALSDVQILAVSNALLALVT